MKLLKWVVVLFFMLSIVVYAKRPPAPIVPDVISHGVRYEAGYHHGGVVEAFSNSKKNRLLWQKRIYRVKYDPYLGKDIQDIFITDLKLKRDLLIIKDEKNRKYSLNLRTREVRRLQ